MKNPYDLIVKPLITEKTLKLVEAGKYTFEVMKGANKTEVKKAIEEIFEVEVQKVNLVKVPKKEVHFGRFKGYKPAVNKAIVTLEKGDIKLNQIFEV